jgi:tetratricopeptide (TPR) repeat protein
MGARVPPKRTDLEARHVPQPNLGRYGFFSLGGIFEQSSEEYAEHAFLTLAQERGPRIVPSPLGVTQERWRVLFCKLSNTRLLPAFRPFSAVGPGAAVRQKSVAVLLAFVAMGTGCSELKARHHAREGNGHYLSGDYPAAVREYEIAEQAYPSGLHVVELNKGLACRQLMVPGSKSPEQERAVDCALNAFNRMKELRPEDPRGDQLYVQTLFDADRFDTLIALYEGQLKGDPNNMAAINSLINVHSRADHWAEALKWSMKRADLESKDAEAQYTVGVMIYNRLFQKGGADKAAYDPRPDPNADPKAPPKTPPPFTMGDLMGAERVRVADLGIQYMNRAIEIRPNYREAMGFMSLLYRQKAFGFLDKPVDWELWVNTAEEWRSKANAPAPAAQPGPEAQPAPEPAATPT